MTRTLATALLLAAFAGTANAQYNDPMGDAQNTFGAGPPLLDIATVSVTYDATTLYFTMTFFTPISPPSASMPDSVGGTLEFDTDQNAATGGTPLQNVFSPPFASLSAGWEFEIDLFSETIHPGMVDILDSTFFVVGTVPIVYGPTSFSGEIPLSMLGNDDGIVDFTTIIGTNPQPTDATDSVATSEAVSECFLILGNGRGDADIQIAGTTYHTQIAEITSFYAVLMDDVPTFPIGTMPAVSSAGLTRSAAPSAFGETEPVRMVAQVMMHNPQVFPQNPDQWSEGVDIEILPSGAVRAADYGTLNGIHLDPRPYDHGGAPHLTFVFTIDGM